MRDLHVAYGRVEALFGVSLDVFAGQVVTVIGSNGAGKSTLLNSIMGALPSRGDILFDSKNIAFLQTEERVEKGICLVPEKRELFSSMSVYDNLMLGAYVHRHDSSARRQNLLESVFKQFPRLHQRSGQIAATLSGGERQMLALGRALMCRPRLLMLDEPSLGLAPRIVGEIFGIISRLRAEGTSILLVEQNARAALHVSDYCYVIENGAIRMQGASEELREDPRIMEAYLGVGT